MQDNNPSLNNPLNAIFIKDSQNKITSEINSPNNIKDFFLFLKDENINDENKVLVIDQFTQKLKDNRYISEYFSSYDNKSIYLYLFDIYLRQKNKDNKLKTSIINLLNELRINIQTGKEIYEYIFQRLTLLYRGEEEINPDNLYNYLKLLYTLLDDTENMQKPNNYFACSGHGKFIFDYSFYNNTDNNDNKNDNKKDINEINIGYSFSIMINFKLSKCGITSMNIFQRSSNLIKINFSNNASINVCYEYPCFITVKEIGKQYIKRLPKDEWINLLLTVVHSNNNLSLYFTVNGDTSGSGNNQNEPLFYLLNSNATFKQSDTIKSIEFFDNFYGEVSSFLLFSQKEQTNIGALTNNIQFLNNLKMYKEGLYKRKKIVKFIDMLSDVDNIINSTINLSNFNSNNIGSRHASRIEEKKSLFDNIVFIFSPINFYFTKPNVIEDYFGKYNLVYNGNIKNHRYVCFQKKLEFVGGLINFFPISEMFLIHPKLLNENNFELFLKIIVNILNFGKENMRCFKESKFFKIFSLFIEKYPNHLFNAKILEAFFDIGKTIFKNNAESLCSNYFKHILLNEKILAKYDENLQVIFWNNMFKFCESDKSQIESLINMNRICLLLRFYDKNKYFEMCCEEHLNMFKEEFVGSKKIMNPTMNKRLSTIKNIMDLIIEAQDPNNAFLLFKLLTLDLSPCLTKFILKIFIKVFQKKNETKKQWIDDLVNILILNDYEIIVTNTFIHSLPDVRQDIIELIFQIYGRAKTQKDNNFQNLEKKIKTCLLPQEMFYAKKEEINKEYTEENITLDDLIKDKKEENINNNNNADKNNISNNIDKRKSTGFLFQQKNKLIQNTLEDIVNKKDDKDNKDKTDNKDNKDNKEDKDDNINDNLENKKKKLLNIKTFTGITTIEEDLLYESKEDNENEEKSEIKENKNKEDLPKDKSENENNKNESNNMENESKIDNKKEDKEINEEKDKDKDIDKEKKEEDIKNKYFKRQTIDNQSIIKKNTLNKNNNNINDETKNDYNNKLVKGDEILIIKDELYHKYIDNLFSMFMVWSFGLAPEVPLNIINWETLEIKYLNGLEILFYLNSELHNYKFTCKYLDHLLKIVTKKSINAYKLIQNRIIISSLLDIVYNNINYGKDRDREDCFNLGKSLLVSILTNALLYIEQNKDNSKYNDFVLPANELETIFIWGDKIISDEQITQKESLYEFLFDLLMEVLGEFKAIVGDKINFKFNEQNFKIKNNFYLKNYLIFVTYLFHYSFLYKLDSIIKNNGLSCLFMSSQKEICLPSVFISSMRLDYNSGSTKISKYWMDFKFFYDLYYRINYIWKKDNIYKKKNKDNKKSKIQKYEHILQNIILDKENKNMYQKELEFLCLEQTKEENNLKIEIITPLIQIIPISLMSILSMINNFQDQEEFNKWLKDFKNFIMFLIISSCNLTRVDQEELYNDLENKSLDAISASICFLKNLSNSPKCLCKEKIHKNLKSIFIFCITIVNYQIGYNAKHKIDKFGKKLFTKKKSRNDLSKCAIYILFTEYIKDKNGIPLISKKLELKENNYDAIIDDILKNEDWKSGFFMNTNLKNKLFEKFYSLNGYNDIVKSRFISIQNLIVDLDNSYRKKLLDLMPLYEQELMKYSNNSLEKNIKKRNQYKTFKKHCFSWRGFWSNRKTFFENISELKVKFTNHYTKSFMKPLLVPILDINYYLPTFSYFNPENIFKNNDKNDKFRLILDIDKILKLSEQNQVVMENIKKTFGDVKKTIKYNYLRNIYLKSNKDLYDNLLRISNNLDFGKEEEFALLNNQNKKSKNKKAYYLGCLVKTSHHIKGVFFIDDKKLNFKVFLNQKTGNSMSGVEIGFSNKDDDYDQERQTCFGSYFKFHPKDKDLYKISIKYDDIKYIFRRKYYYKNSGLEIYTNTNKSFYFNFKFETDRESAILDITLKLKDSLQIIDDLKEQKEAFFNNIVGYQNISSNLKKNKKSQKKLRLSKIVSKWKEWKITNFEFLMWLNIFGNRSYNDISQYPVFPWILSNYEDPLKVEQKIKIVKTNIAHFLRIDSSHTPSFSTVDSSPNINNNKDNKDNKEVYQEIIDYKYRDLSLPMGMLELNPEGVKRKELFMETYLTLKNESEEMEKMNKDNNEEETNDENPNQLKPYIFGSNYSNPFYICNYLMRIFPFTHISIELQGHEFDKPDRLFISVVNTFYMSTTQKTDVRELVPEFFFLPEMFLNVNNLNMGVLENGTEVNDIKTPCHNNPYEFIMIMKTVLESDKISYNINNWIDLIFGIKARGKEAELANNIFTETSYQENIDLNKKKNKEALLRLVEFGLIPNQIMSKECPKREKKENIVKGKEITDSTSDLKIFKCKTHNTKKNNYILKIATNGEKINILNNSNMFIDAKISWVVFEKKYNEEIVNKYKIDQMYNKISDYQYPNEYNDKNIIFCENNKKIVIGGFYDGKIVIISTEPRVTQKEIIPFSEEFPIISIAINKNEEYLFVGNTNGNIKIYKIKGEIEKCEYLCLISDQFSPIIHINCNEELNMWTSATIDGYINIYTLPLCKLIRCIKVPTNKCNYAFLSAFPLPSIVIITEEGDEDKKGEIFVYSINGHLFMRQKEQSLISSPQIIKDINSYDYLAYIGKNNVIIRSLPNLFMQVIIEDLPDIYAICPSEDMKILYAFNQSGDEVYVIKEENKKVLLINKNNANNNK